MKYCKKCDSHKSKEDFGRDKHKKDGLYFYCKECTRKKSTLQRKSNPEYYKRYSEKYRQENREVLRIKAMEFFWENREKRLESGKKSYHKLKDKINKNRKVKRDTPEARKKEAERQRVWRSKNALYKNNVRRWQIKNREKVNAHAKVHRAVANGNLKRSPVCKECGIKCKTEGHHEDYSKPLKVKWLCRKCHGSKLEVIEV